MSRGKTEGDGVTRLSFLKASAGAAAGAAAIGVPAAAVLTDEKPRIVPEPHSPNPREPVIAYVRDAERGEVTVLAGTSETTYQDRALVKKLLNAAPSEAATNGGGMNVLAP